MACILLLPFSWLTFWRYLAVADLHGLLLWFSLWDAQIVAVLYTYLPFYILVTPIQIV